MVIGWLQQRREEIGLRNIIYPLQTQYNPVIRLPVYIIIICTEVIK